jgi:hypothetical protein
VSQSTDPRESADALDAVTAAPDHHAVVFENDRVRVLDALVEIGETVPLHTHRWPGVQYLVSIDAFVRRNADGEVVVDSRTIELSPERPVVLWSEPLAPHTLENVGTEPIRAIVFELKSAQSDP